MIVSWSKGPADHNMPEEMLLETLGLVQRHPWWQARAQLALALLRRHGLVPPAKLIEVGCGWGINLDALEKAGYDVRGLDISRQILERIDRPSRHLIEADLNQELPAEAGQSDGLLALDVLEHLDDDRSVTRRMASLLRPGGVAVVSVPARPDLSSEFDRIQGHRRRYLPEQLRAVFEGSGLKVREVSWWGAWMVPVLCRMRRGKEPAARTRPKTYADYLRLPPWPAPWLMRLLYQWEEKRTLEGKLTTGTSLFAIAVRSTGT